MDASRLAPSDGGRTVSVFGAWLSFTDPRGRLILTSIASAVLGLVILGGGYWFLTGPDHRPLETLASAAISGAAGTFVATYWVRKLPGGSAVQWLMIFAYGSRLIVGLALYLYQDPHYFEGAGGYATDLWEYLWTYENACRVVDATATDLGWRGWDAIPEGSDKNAAVHTVMGWFLALGGNCYAMDLAPLNAFHHIIAASVLIAIASAAGYTARASLLAGVALAWIPWAFPASLMWRDSIGLSWVVVAVALVGLPMYIGRLGAILTLPAAALAFADRKIYAAAIVGISLFCWLNSYHAGPARSRATSVILVAIALAVPLYLFNQYRDTLFIVYEDFSLADRALGAPLLILRALAGPFPWFGGDSVIQNQTYQQFDYLYHVLQLAVLMVCLEHPSRFWRGLDYLRVSGIVYLSLGVFATGVHTAYLAVGLPFLFPFVFEVCKHFSRRLGLAAVLFIAANLVYSVSGLHGRSLIQGITGY